MVPTLGGSLEKCQTCRQRRVKCDNVRPTCTPCQKSRRICLAVGNMDSTIHSENDYASGRIKRPRGPRSSFRPSRVNLEHKALTFYKNEFLLPKKVALNGSLSECVRAWQASGRVSGFVDLAIRALALAKYSRVFNNSQAAAEALVKYKAVLDMVQSEIKGIESFDLADFDPLLLTSFLMGRLENVVLMPSGHSVDALQSSFLTASMFSHQDGVLALLKTWHGVRKEDSPISTIVKLCRRGQLRLALLRERPLPSWICDGSQFGEQERDLIYDNIFVNAVNLHARIVSVRQASKRDWLEVHLINITAQDTLRAITEWSNHLQPYLEYECQGISDTPALHFYSRKVLHFENLPNAYAWARYSSLKMFLVSLQCDALSLYEADFHESAKTRIVREPLEAMAHQFAGIIPFCLSYYELKGDKACAVVDHQPRPYLASQILFDVGITLRVKELSASFIKWLESEIDELGKLCGDRMVSFHRSFPQVKSLDRV